MQRFIIGNNDQINRIVPGTANRSGKIFGTKEQLRRLFSRWPGTRLVEIWNELPGVKPVRKFTDRRTAIDRIWNAIQQSRSETAASTARFECSDQPKESGKTPGDRGTTWRTRSVQAGSKKAKILKLLKRPTGATLEKLMRVTGWQAHSVRGFISAGVNKRMDLRVTSNRREDGQRVYQIR